MSDDKDKRSLEEDWAFLVQRRGGITPYLAIASALLVLALSIAVLWR